MNYQDLAAEIADAYRPPSTGRPSLIADRVIVASFLEAIAQGGYLEPSAYLAGANPMSVYRWLKRGEAGEKPYDRFLWSYKRACAQAESEMVRVVRDAAKAGPQYWAAGMTYLERRNPDRWGKRPDDGTVPKVLVQIGASAQDVQITLSPPPDTPGGETLTIPSGNHAESDNAGYVNHAKQLSGQTLVAAERRERVATPRGNRRANPRGTQARPRPSPLGGGGSDQSATGGGRGKKEAPCG